MWSKVLERSLPVASRRRADGVVVKGGCGCTWKGGGGYGRISEVRMRPLIRFKRYQGESQLAGSFIHSFIHQSVTEHVVSAQDGQEVREATGTWQGWSNPRQESRVRELPGGPVVIGLGTFTARVHVHPWSGN